MNRSVVVYALLLAGALVGSYLSWTSESETTSAKSVTIARFAPEDIDSMTWETDEKRLEIDVRSNDRGRYGWVREISKDAGGPTPNNPPGDTGTPADVSRTGPDAGTTERADSGDTSGSNAESRTPGRKDPSGKQDEPEKEFYRASSAFQGVLEDLNPLRARRKLSMQGKERKKVFGFDDPRATWTILAADGSDRKFTVGSYAYGDRYFYLRDDSKDAYYVVDADVISPFRYAETQLPQRQVVDVDARKLKRIRVQTDRGTVELVQHNAADRRAAHWTIGKEGKKSRTAETWVNRVLQLRAERYLPDSRPKKLKTTAVFHIQRDGGPKMVFKLFEKSTGEGKTRYYGESDFTTTLVELKRSSASPVVADLDTLLEGGSRSENEVPPGSSENPAPPGSAPAGNSRGGPSDRKR